VPNVIIDYNSPVPVYQQVGRVIADRIIAGVLLPGRPIPSEQSLMQEFGVARDTARRATRWLREQGLIQTIAQRGSFVLEQRGADEPGVAGGAGSPVDG
jgi:GntR family transcriptional regulator